MTIPMRTGTDEMCASLKSDKQFYRVGVFIFGLIFYKDFMSKRNINRFLNAVKKGAELLQPSKVSVL